MSIELADYGLDFTQFRPDEIIAPQSPDLKLVFVVPIRGEVSNGNFFSLLKDMMRQTAAKSTFELVLIVNQGTNYRFADENDQIINMAKFLNDLGPLPFSESTDQWKNELLETARGAHIKVTALPRLDRYQSMNIEVFRAIGNYYAAERLKASEFGLNGAVCVLDADTRISANTVQTIIDQFANHPEVGMLTINLDMYPGEGDEGIWTSNPFERLDLLSNRLKSFGKPSRSHPWHAVRASQLKLPDLATLNARDSESTLLHLKDYLSLPREYQTRVMPPAVSFITQDRARPESVGGITGSARFSEIKDGISPGRNLEHPLDSLIHNGHLKSLDRSSPIRQKIDGLYKNKFGITPKDMALGTEARRKADRVKAKDFGYMWFMTLIALMEGVAPAELDELEDCVLKTLRAERLRHKLFRSKTHSFFRQCFDYLKMNREQKITLTTKTAQAFIPFHERPFFTTFFGKADWLVGMINFAIERCEDFESFLEFFENRFPEFLRPFQDTECGETNAYLLGLSRYFEHATNNPEKFPSTANFWGFNSTSPASPPHTD